MGTPVTVPRNRRVAPPRRQTGRAAAELHPSPGTKALAGTFGRRGGGAKTRTGKSAPTVTVADGQALSIDALCQLASGAPFDREATATAITALRLLDEARLRRGLTMARRHGLPAVAVVMATPLSECRWDGRVPEETVRAQHLRVRQAVPLLLDEGFDHITHVLCTRSSRNEQE